VLAKWSYRLEGRGGTFPPASIGKGNAKAPTFVEHTPNVAFVLVLA
jgi:hypothetical protein